MFLSEFGLSVHPFGISPRLDFLYKSGAFEESIAHLVYGLDNSEAIIMITGAIGTGKTMAIQSFLSFLGDRYLSALVTNTSVDAKELLKLVLEDLGVPLEPGADKSDLLIAFKKFLIASGRDGKRIIVVIDEAQNLSREALEEIRLLTNLGQGEEQPVQIVLSGQPELEAALKRPDLAQLRQRIRVHYKLAPLSRRELEEYVDHRMTVAGGSAGVYSKGALDRIYELSTGVPRVVNTLCGEALLAAYVAGRLKVEARDLDDQQPEVPPPAPPVSIDDTAPLVAPTSMPPVAEMAVRRSSASPGESVMNAPGRVKKASQAGAAAAAADRAGARRRAGGGIGWLLGAIGIATVLAVFVATGRLGPLWSRLPLMQDASRPTGDSMDTDHHRPVVRPSDLEAARERTVPDGSAGRAADSARAVGDRQDEALAAGSVAVVASPEGGPSDDVEQVTEAPATVPEAGQQLSEPAPQLVTQAAPQTGQDPAETASVSTGREAAGEFYVHVSSFRTPEQAGYAAKKLSESGLPSTVHRQLIRDVQWYRVYMGPYSSHDDAVRLANRLRDEGTITYYKVLRLGADDGL